MASSSRPLNTSVPLWPLPLTKSWSLPALSAFGIIAAVCLFDDSLAWVSAQAPLILFMAPLARPVVFAAWAGSNLTYIGSVGAVSFLGTTEVSEGSIVQAVLFANSFAVAYYVWVRRCMNIRFGVMVSSRVQLCMLLIACALLMARFVGGVPLLAGNEARLSGVLSVSPLLGLASGSFAIAAAYVRAPRSNLTVFLGILLVVLALGSGSRLLFLVVVVGLGCSYYPQSDGYKRFVYSLGFTSCIALALFGVYRLRSSDLAQRLETSKLDALTGLAGWFAEVVGPGVFLSARNGLAVSELIQAHHLAPPNGYIIGGLLNSARMGVDPERWLTTALGFTELEVGAVATPIWSGLVGDLGFGLLFILGSAVFGCTVGFLTKIIPGSAPWFAVSTAMSFYGSYFVSAQFLAATMLLYVVFRVSATSGVHRRVLQEAVSRD